jgi:hypothetical protein
MYLGSGLFSTLFTQVGAVHKLLRLLFYTQYMKNPDMVYVLKMEYVSKINIFGLKMMMKSGLEKIFLKFLHAQGLFQTS